MNSTLVEDNKDSNEKVKASRRPKDGKFHQQKLPGCQPSYTAKTIFPLFLIIGVIFLAAGITMMIFVNKIQEVSVMYTHCQSTVSDTISCSRMILNSNVSFPECKCNVNFKIPKDLEYPVYFYYGLESFYQNHRLYYKSRDDRQLNGQNIAPDKLRTSCAPYKISNGKAVAPCGLIANSIFNDTFVLKYNGQDVAWTSRHISWESDRTVSFGKPKDFSNTEKPPNWKLTASQRSPNAYEGDEELLVWMRAAALPNFRKLHRIINTNPGPVALKDKLVAGDYSLLINYAFPVSSFGGAKKFILSTTSVLGGRNFALPIAFISVGSLDLIFAIMFIAMFTYLNDKEKKSIMHDKSKHFKPVSTSV